MTGDQDRRPGGAGCIYVVEDDPGVSRILVATLSDFGFEAVPCRSAAELRRRLLAQVPDLCIIDLGLPDADGMDLVRQLQAQHDCGVLILTGRGYASDRVMGLELGADDYVVKPFEPRELVARVRSILRRQQKAATPEGRPRAMVAEFAGWRFHADSNLLRSPDGNEWTLSAGEARILTVFLQRPNRILDREQLCGDRDLSPLDRSVDVRISRLRRKIEADPQDPKTIRTVYGAGYLFAAEVRWI
ncbi:MAG TPA: response regulator transcription factor [Lysobacter sp.]|jgi:DNA-binding response OmpR family regulator|nr:response regulator transcription factor [Lysobacter sp.]